MAINKEILNGERGKKDRDNKEIRDILSQFKERYSLSDCLELMRRRYPHLLETALERLERKKERNELPEKEIIKFERFKQSLH